MSLIKQTVIHILSRKAGAPLLLAAGGALLAANLMSEQERKKTGKRLIYAGLAGLYPIVQNIISSYKAKQQSKEIKEENPR